MKILFVIHNPNNPRLGATRIYRVLESVFSSQSHQVDMIYLDDSNISTTKIIALAQTRFYLPTIMSNAARIREISTYDVVMGSSGMIAPLASSFAGKSKRPVFVNHLHGLCLYDHASNLNEANLRHWPTSLLYRAVTGPFQVNWDFMGCQACDITIVQNRRDYSFLIDKDFGSRVSFIPASLDPGLFTLSEHVKAHDSREPFSILWFGTWESRKGAYYVPLAFRMVREVFPQAVLTLGGTGKLPDQLLKAFSPEDVGNIRVLGHVSDSEYCSILNDQLVFLFPSVSEGFGLALVEAMAFGLAAVTTSTGFAADHLTADDNAVVVSLTAWHLAQGCIRLFSDSSFREKVARNGRSTARHFTPQRMANAYERLFLENVESLENR